MLSCGVDRKDGGGGWSASPGGTEQVPDKDASGGDVERRNDDDDEGVVADDNDDMAAAADGASRSAVDEDRVLVVEGDAVTVAPDGGWGWMIVLVSFLCASVVDGLCSVFGVMLPDLVMYFDQSSSTVATAGSLLAGGFLLYGISLILYRYISWQLDSNAHLFLFFLF